jgi:hypothetical protein
VEKIQEKEEIEEANQRGGYNLPYTLPGTHLDRSHTLSWIGSGGDWPVSMSEYLFFVTFYSPFLNGNKRNKRKRENESKRRGGRERRGKGGEKRKLLCREK